MSSYADKVAILRGRVHDISRELANLLERRKQHALEAVDGNERAKKILAEIEFAADGLRRESQQCETGIELAEQSQRETVAKEKADVLEQKRRGAARLAEAVTALGEKIDLAGNGCNGDRHLTPTCCCKEGRAYEPSSISREGAHLVRPTPLALSDEQLAELRQAAAALPVLLRDDFLRLIAAHLELEGGWVGDAAFARAIRFAFNSLPTAEGACRQCDGP